MDAPVVEINHGIPRPFCVRDSGTTGNMHSSAILCGDYVDGDARTNHGLYQGLRLNTSRAQGVTVTNVVLSNFVQIMETQVHPICHDTVVMQASVVTF